MFIGDDGRIFGTIGGGCVEAEIWTAARNVYKDAKAQDAELQAGRRSRRGRRDDMRRERRYLLEPALPRYKNLYTGIRDLEKTGKDAFIITRFTSDSFSKSLVGQDGLISGDDLTEEMKERVGSHLGAKGPVVADGLIIEPVISSPTLYLFGAGHVSQFVSKIAALADFDVTVIDDRAEFANRERFPEAQEVIVDNFQSVFDRLQFSGREYIAILTRGHKHDALVLEEAMKKPRRYIGMIGSRRKTKMIYDHLKRKGVPEAALEAVHAPIGLSIQAETPQEIAVSIVAELIQIKRKA